MISGWGLKDLRLRLVSRVFVFEYSFTTPYTNTKEECAQHPDPPPPTSTSTPPGGGGSGCCAHSSVEVGGGVRMLCAFLFRVRVRVRRSGSEAVVFVDVDVVKYECAFDSR
eukprot:scaffold165765_cov34-Tisochrysis_lutea.AAC.1